MALSLATAVQEKRLQRGSIIALYSPERIEIMRLLWADGDEMCFCAINNETNRTYTFRRPNDFLYRLQYEYLDRMEEDEWNRFVEFMRFSAARKKLI